MGVTLEEVSLNLNLEKSAIKLEKGRESAIILEKRLSAKIYQMLSKHESLFMQSFGLRGMSLRLHSDTEGEWYLNIESLLIFLFTESDQPRNT